MDQRDEKLSQSFRLVSARTFLRTSQMLTDPELGAVYRQIFEAGYRDRIAPLTKLRQAEGLVKLLRALSEAARKERA